MQCHEVKKQEWIALSIQHDAVRKPKQLCNRDVLVGAARSYIYAYVCYIYVAFGEHPAADGLCVLFCSLGSKSLPILQHRNLIYKPPGDLGPQDDSIVE